MEDLETRLNNITREIIKIIDKYPLSITPKRLWEPRRQMLKALYDRRDLILRKLGV